MYNLTEVYYHPWTNQLHEVEEISEPDFTYYIVTTDTDMFRMLSLKNFIRLGIL